MQYLATAPYWIVAIEFVDAAGASHSSFNVGLNCARVHAVEATQSLRSKKQC